MIYKAIIPALNTIEELHGKIYPVAVEIDDKDPPFAVYNFGQRVPVAAVNGRIHHYSDSIQIDFWGVDYPQLVALYNAAEDALRSLIMQPVDGGFILNVQCEHPAEADAAVLELDKLVRRMVVQIDWKRK